MIRSQQENHKCIINGNDTKYTECSTDVKLLTLAYNSQITTTLELSVFEMIFNQKPQKPIMFTANSSKNKQAYCQPTKESMHYNLLLRAHDEDHLHHPKKLILAFGTDTEWISNKKNKNKKIKNKKKFIEIWRTNYYKDKSFITK